MTSLSETSVNPSGPQSPGPSAQDLRAPFPYFGGKRRVASLVWQALGDVRNYVEPFVGSAAVLLSRPTEPRIETINDRDCMIANFWRAITWDPVAVAEWTDWPVNEADLHARHKWLVERRQKVRELLEDPTAFDPMVAGWWVWGISQWIGGGWCAEHPWGPEHRRPHISGNSHGHGVHRKRPVAGADNPGRGVHQMPRAYAEGGQGVHGAQLTRKRPHLSGAGGGVGVHSTNKRHLGALVEWFEALAARLRSVRVICGDWRRVTGDSVILGSKKATFTSGIFLDPPYRTSERANGLYAVDQDVAVDVRDWALEKGNNERLRIVVAGYEGLMDGTTWRDDGWREIRWSTSGGYGNQKKAGRGRSNASRERLFLSPYCLNDGQLDMWADQQAT